MAENNRQIAGIFQQMADILELTDGNRFRINAFVRAARTIDELTQDVAEIDRKELSTIPGIGKGTAERIAEFLETGQIAEHQKLAAQVPAGLLKLLSIPGLGPKTVAQLWKERGITGEDDLRKALDDGTLVGLRGMGEKKIENIRKNIAFIATAGLRARIGKAMPLAKWFIEKLEKMKPVDKAGFAGCLRRGRETIGDIDLLVAADPKDARRISDAFIKLAPVAEVIGSGETKTSVRVKEEMGGLQVDLRIVPAESFGAALLYFTGSKDHNIQLRERAIKRKMLLNEYGLFDADEKLVAGETEEAVYKALGLAWVPPELREARGEVELAEADKLPRLIELSDIKAELHTHTTASDGTWSIRELAEAAAARGFHTVAVTDHSKSQVQARGLTLERLEAHIEQVREVAAAMKDTITILAGSEVDILSDGALDYPDTILKELDVVVASPHAALTQDSAKATKRLLAAIENPYVTILGHPTGRIIGRREGLSPDIGKIAKAAAQRGIALEINANHYRLDLRDTHVRVALEAGAKIAINTDAHGPADLDELTYGVLTARRGGATKDDVINCYSRTALAKWLRSTRG